MVAFRFGKGVGSSFSGHVWDDALQLDSFTVLVASCAAMSVIGLAFVYFWFQDRRSPWLIWWSIPFIFSGFAVAFYTRPNWESEAFAIYAANGIRILTVCCLWFGVRAFYGRTPLWLIFALIPIVWGALCLYGPFFASTPARVAIVSLAVGLFSWLTVFELWRGRTEPLPSRRPALIVFASFATFLTVRALLVNQFPFPMGGLPPDPFWLGVLTLITFVHAIFAAFLFLSLTKERHEAEQHNFAISDPLTGLLNRRAFYNFVERAGRRQMDQQATSLLVLDLDHFKSINDRFGHDIGDRMLTAFAVVAETNMRPTDMLFRMGGEEFCFVLPDTGTDGAVQAAERMRRAFELVQVDAGKERARGTVSVGVASSTHAVDLELLLAAADAAVYEAKTRGRNRVVVAEPLSIRRSNLTAGEAPLRRRA